MEASVHLHIQPPVAVLRIEGSLDVASRGPLAWRLVDLLDTDCHLVRFDTGGVDHVDLACLRMLDDAWRRLTARGTDCQFRAASPAFVLTSARAGYRVLAQHAGRPVPSTVGSA